MVLKCLQVIQFLLSGLHTANLSLQTRVGKLQKAGKLVPSHVKLRQITTHAKFVKWPMKCSGTHEELPLLSCSCCMLIGGEETESAGIIERFGRNGISVEI